MTIHYDWSAKLYRMRFEGTSNTRLGDADPLLSLRACNLLLWVVRGVPGLPRLGCARHPPSLLHYRHAPNKDRFCNRLAYAPKRVAANCAASGAQAVVSVEVVTIASVRVLLPKGECRLEEVVQSVVEVRSDEGFVISPLQYQDMQIKVLLHDTRLSTVGLNITSEAALLNLKCETPGLAFFHLTVNGFDAGAQFFNRLKPSRLFAFLDVSATTPVLWRNHG